MTQTGWHLERTLVSGAGFPEARLEGLDLTWTDHDTDRPHAALWADNGTGKTTITALRYALYRPHARDFIRGNSDRSLAKLVRSGDVAHVVEQAYRVIGGQLQRIVIGMVAAWPGAGTQDLDSPSRLDRYFYGWVGNELAPTIDELPLRTGNGRWATRRQYCDAIRELVPDGGLLPAHLPATDQGSWQAWLATAGIDLEQIRFQARMNASEGGVDAVMKFDDSDAFVSWLIGAVTPTAVTDQIRRNIDVLRDKSAALPRWQREADLWATVMGPLQQLSAAHTDLQAQQTVAAAAALEATAAHADAQATIAALRQDVTGHQQQVDELTDARGRIATRQRRATAHRQRMAWQAAQLRADEATRRADRLEQQRDDARRQLYAWELVGDHQHAEHLAGQIAGMEQQVASEQAEAADLLAQERQLRHQLARLLTDQLDQATESLQRARTVKSETEAEVSAADTALEQAQRDDATATRDITVAEQDLRDGERTLEEAVTAGLLEDGQDPERVVADLDIQIADTREQQHDALTQAREQREGASQHRTDANGRIGQAQQAEQAAKDAEGQLRTVARRADRIVHHPQVAVLGLDRPDPWADKDLLATRLEERAADADSALQDAKADTHHARRILGSIRGDGLLPAAELADRIVARLADMDEPIAATTGWQWLARSLTGPAAAEFATARPEVAAGVVLHRTADLTRARTVLNHDDVDTAVWVGTVHDIDQAVRGQLGGTTGQVVLPHPGTYDRDAARELVDAAQQRLDATLERTDHAKQTGDDTRTVKAQLASLIDDHPDDPRPGWQATATSNRQHEQEHRNAAADLHARATQADAAADAAQDRHDQAVVAHDQAVDRRQDLTSVLEATSRARNAQRRLPILRSDQATAREDIRRATSRKDAARTELQGATDEVDRRTDAVEDLDDQMRDAGLTRTREGPVPDTTTGQLHARIEVLTDRRDETVDGDLRDRLDTARKQHAELHARLTSDPELYEQVAELATTEQARHGTARQAAIADARKVATELHDAYSTASAEATMRREERDKLDRPDDARRRAGIDELPEADQVDDPVDADRYVTQLDQIVEQTQEQLRAHDTEIGSRTKAAEQASRHIELIETAAGPLADLADDTPGRPAADPQMLRGRLTEADRKLRQANEQVSRAREQVAATLDMVRGKVTSPTARTVGDDEHTHPKIVDLLDRLREDSNVPADADRLAIQLHARVVSLQDDLDSHAEDVRTTAKLLHTQAAAAIDQLRAYQNQSRMVGDLGDWTGQQFVTIGHDPIPDDEGVAVDRIARVVDSMLAPSARTDAHTLLFGAARALVASPFRVRILKPHTDLHVDRVPVDELKNFSGGQRVTAGVLMYATMTKVRSATAATSVGWLWLDNPFGQASADQFVRTMRQVADQFGLQLLFTAAPKDKGSLSMFDRILALATRSRPAAREKVVVVESDSSRQVVDQHLVQREVAEVLGA